MKNIMKNRKALSTVVTTLIILVVSVLLAGVVTYYAINVTSTRVQEESLNLTYQHVWYSTTDTMPEAAIMITNTGGRDVVLQNIAIRGQSVPTAQIEWVNPTNIVDLPYVSQATPGTYVVPTALGATLTFTAATNGPITLPSGKTIAVYIFAVAYAAGPPVVQAYNPGSVTVNDVGLTIAISIFTAQATYYKETNVNSAP